MNSGSQIGGMHTSPMNITPQGLGMMPSQPSAMMGGGVGGHSGMNMMHSGLSTQPQPVQQLSQFVSNATFSNQQSNIYGQQLFYQQQVIF